MRILLFGKSGQIGSRLLTTLAPLGDVIASASSDANFREPGFVISSIRDHHPDIIVNAAAYTAVDNAERESGTAQLVNATAPGLIAQEAARIGAAVVHYSTDYVFDGCKPSAYLEKDPPAPGNVYGRTKLAGEQGIANSGAAHLIFRTSWIYAATGKNFLLSILRLAQTQPELRIVADQVGSPTSANVVATATARALTAALAKHAPASPADALRPYSGVYHLTCQGSVTWHGFACEILAQAHALDVLSRATPPRVTPISTQEFPRPAKRPANSVLDCTKFTSTFGITLPHWKDALSDVLAQIASRNRK